MIQRSSGRRFSKRSAYPGQRSRKPKDGNPRVPRLEFDAMEQHETFAPPEEFRRSASIKSINEYRQMYDSARQNTEAFWAEQAKALHWFAPWSKVLDWSNPPFAKWFS